MTKNKSSVILRDMPERVKKIIYKKQSKEKIKAVTAQLSLSKTIYMIIEDWDKLRKIRK